MAVLEWLYETSITGFVDLEHWSRTQWFEHILPLRSVADALLNLIRYLESNADSMPDYGVAT